MSADEIIRYVLSFLGGGLVAAIGNWLHATVAARREREASYLEQQLRSLYGPLSFFATQNEQLFKLGGQIHHEYSAFFKGPWSPDPETHRQLSQEMSATIELSNEYVNRVTQNNMRVMEILEQNWHLADLEDAEVFARFQLDHARFVTEVREERRKNVPFPILEALV